MARTIHVNPDNGNVGTCGALYRCPFDVRGRELGIDTHFASREEAEVMSARILTEKFGAFSLIAPKSPNGEVINTVLINKNVPDGVLLGATSAIAQRQELLNSLTDADVQKVQQHYPKMNASNAKIMIGLGEINADGTLKLDKTVGRMLNGHNCTATDMKHCPKHRQVFDALTDTELITKDEADKYLDNLQLKRDSEKLEKSILQTAEQGSKDDYNVASYGKDKKIAIASGTYDPKELAVLARDVDEEVRQAAWANPNFAKHFGDPDGVVSPQAFAAPGRQVRNSMQKKGLVQRVSELTKANIQALRITAARPNNGQMRRTIGEKKLSAEAMSRQEEFIYNMTSFVRGELGYDDKAYAA